MYSAMRFSKAAIFGALCFNSERIESVGPRYFFKASRCAATLFLRASRL